MGIKLTDNPEVIEILKLVHIGLTKDELHKQVGANYDHVSNLLKTRYLINATDDFLVLSEKGREAIGLDKKNHKPGIKAANRSPAPTKPLKLPRHPRQDEIDAMRAIPPVFNGVRYVAK